VPLQRKPSEYMRQNFYITTSGMPWAPAINFAQSVMGVDRVLYAMDYPYQYFPEEVVMSDQVPMSDADRLKFFQSNAEKVFKLGGTR
jgi:2,3-dihydroxybenzoate decarboxylase